ncbi:hypothetical protein BH10ACT3_BH10ACT3_06990 [soil metagenome]
MTPPTGSGAESTVSGWHAPTWMRDESGELSHNRTRALTIFFVLALYTVATLPGVAAKNAGFDLDFHAKVADAFMHGRLDIRPVPPELSALEDPYDPTANYSIRFPGEGNGVAIHDLAFHNGKLYSLHGPTQAVLVNIPFELMGLPAPPNFLATLMFITLGFLAAVAIIEQLRVRFMATLPLWAECSMIIAVGLATPAWWILTIGRGYESAIACGYGLLMAGLALLLRAVRDAGRPNRWLLAGGAFCLAAAVGARPHLFVAGAYLVFVAITIVVARRRSGTTHGLGQDLLALFTPYAVIGGLLMAYNIARFGSPTDYGTQYQLSFWNMQSYPLAQLSYIAPNLHDYILALPQFHWRPPFVSLQNSTFTFTPEYRSHFHEALAGTLFLYPLVPVGLVICAASARRMWRLARPLAAGLGIALVLAVVVLLELSFPFNSSTMRYTVDFVPSLVLVVTIGWGWSYSQYAGSATIRRVLTGAWLGALAVTVAFGLAGIVAPCSSVGTC